MHLWRDGGPSLCSAGVPLAKQSILRSIKNLFQPGVSTPHEHEPKQLSLGCDCAPKLLLASAPSVMK